ncbi:putative secreted protein [Clostridium bornimense]|uniref:Putative secreted protein n=1 Tax=Clostridium bornimense TaxID=1216932 RepID=W6S6R1_9CLOT|nr:hypothetical protein [Clostridium bornimense]CDM70072.1 putative secreted protein [Clostridium bornimense]
MMKNLIKSVIFAITFMLLTSVVAKADSEISLKRIYTSADSVEVSIDNVNTIVSSFQLSLRLEGSVKLKDIVWSKELNKNVKTNFKYNSNDNILDIYVTSKENLVSKSGEIVIGTLKVAGTKKGSFNIVPNLEKATGALKLVSNRHKEIVISDMAIAGESDFVFPGDTPSIDSNKPENNTPEDGGQPSDSNELGSSTSEENKNTIALNNNTEANSGTNSSDGNRYNEMIENIDSSNEKDHMLNDSNDFEDVENEILSEDNENHISQVNDEADLNKEKSKSNNFIIYIAGAIITLTVGIGIYIKVK